MVKVRLMITVINVPRSSNDNCDKCTNSYIYTKGPPYDNNVINVQTLEIMPKVHLYDNCDKCTFVLKPAN